MILNELRDVLKSKEENDISNLSYIVIFNQVSVHVWTHTLHVFNNFCPIQSFCTRTTFLGYSR